MSTLWLPTHWVHQPREVVAGADRRRHRRQVGVNDASVPHSVTSWILQAPIIPCPGGASPYAWTTTDPAVEKPSREIGVRAGMACTFAAAASRHTRSQSVARTRFVRQTGLSAGAKAAKTRVAKGARAAADVAAKVGKADTGRGRTRLNTERHAAQERRK